MRIGDGAYVAAGSMITDNVPPDALAIARGRQANKPGWARQRRLALKKAAKPKKASRSKPRSKPSAKRTARKKSRRR